MIICPENNCTGCGVCEAVCPVACIAMRENELGEKHPNINESICIKCGRCMLICPVNKEQKLNTPINCYAAWNEDSIERKKSASGGLATLFSHAVIENGGVVFGVKYNKDFTPITAKAVTIDELEAFKGSKYVQSNISTNTYREIRHCLMDGKIVLFIGVPCQIAGLKSYLKNDYSNLYTIDLLCHGTTPSSYFKQEIEYLQKQHGIGKFDNIRFRGNDEYNFHLTFWNGEKCLYDKSGNTQPYLYGFLYGLTLRKSCYSCRYAKPERAGDITLGDFISLGTKIPFPHKTENTSYCTTNTEKGEELYNFIVKKFTSLKTIKRQIEERFDYPLSILKPVPENHKTKRFRSLYKKHGFSISIRRALLPTFILNKIKKIYRDLHHIGHIILHRKDLKKSL